MRVGDHLLHPIIAFLKSIIIFAMMIGAFACSAKSPRIASELDVFAYPPEKAKLGNVLRTADATGARASLSYELSVPYPASDLIQWLRSTATDEGWKPDYEFKATSKWWSYEDHSGTTPQTVQQYGPVRWKKKQITMTLYAMYYGAGIEDLRANAPAFDAKSPLCVTLIVERP